jgi:ABC-type branched-subunit amino acid transport system permease subunit
VIGAVFLVSIQQTLALPAVSGALRTSLGGLFPGVADVGPPLSLVFIGVILVLIVIFMPKGVISLYDKIRGSLASEDRQQKKTEAKKP